MRIPRLRSKLKVRLRRRDHQIEKFKRDHERGHARRAHREAHAVRWLRRLIGVEVKHRREAPKVMFDSVTVSEIPKDAPAVAGYVDGSWQTFPVLVHDFPHAHKLSIAVFAGSDALCLDIEPGNATAAESPGWVHRQMARVKHEPHLEGWVWKLYGSVAWVPEIVAELAHAGVPGDAVEFFTAHYTFEPHICGPKTCGALSFNAGGTQYTNVALGRNLDESRLSPHFFG